jgi:hypothetical protein
MALRFRQGAGKDAVNVLSRRSVGAMLVPGGWQRTLGSTSLTLRGFGMGVKVDVRERQQRAAQNQSLFREVNERVKDLNDSFHVFTSTSDWICECANDDCFERIQMSAREYEDVRRHGSRFFVAPSEQHVWPEAENVVERFPNYWIVEKLEEAAEIAEEHDPRSDGAAELSSDEANRQPSDAPRR